MQRGARDEGGRRARPADESEDRQVAAGHAHGARPAVGAAPGRLGQVLRHSGGPVARAGRAHQESPFHPWSQVQHLADGASPFRHAPGMYACAKGK